MMHRHRWEIRAAQPMRIFAHPDSKRPFATETDILYVCSVCGKAKNENVDGHWSLSDLRADAVGASKGDSDV